MQMAKLPDGIFGGIRGRIGNIVGVKRNGKFHIRSIPDNVKNPKTKKQQQNRNKFGIASSLASKLKPFIKRSFSTDGEKSWRGAFISYNMSAAIKPADDEQTFEIIYPNLVLSAGVLYPPEDVTAERDDDGNIRISWTDNSGEGNASPDDKLLAVAINEDGPRLTTAPESTARKAEVSGISLPKSYSQSIVHIYICMMAADESISSNTVYLGEV